MSKLRKTCYVCGKPAGNRSVMPVISTDEVVLGFLHDYHRVSTVLRAGIRLELRPRRPK